MPTYKNTYDHSCGGSGTSSNSSDSSSEWRWVDNDDNVERKMKKKPQPKPGPELEDELLKIITSNYFSVPQFVWFMDRGKRVYNDKIIGILQKHRGLSPFIYDPINGDWKHNMPGQHSWREGLITDCLEHHDGHIVRANVIKFALTCLIPCDSRTRLTIVVKKEMGLETEDVIDLARMANAESVWVPDQFKEIEDRICIAAK
jgi:hypothetical protein